MTEENRKRRPIFEWIISVFLLLGVCHIQIEVIPRFARMFADIGVELPGVTRFSLVYTGVLLSGLPQCFF